AAIVGYSDYTARNVLDVAFSMLNQPYGWGDSNGDWDCSSLLKAIYGVFGIHLPRNGGNQEKAGTLVESYDKISAADKEKSIMAKATAGLTMVRMPGHIMLYIGSHAGKAYVLHDVYGYSAPVDGGDKVFVINRTVVTDLQPGSGSKRGSWLSRVNSIVDVR
ncbi:MAG: NlpC/P60 family protein, partial [Candidatus Cloacimonadaceae bacterium]|nr:NlpC/P60 family protein [Candidatus Cloacimonadaceae bacterium]